MPRKPVTPSLSDQDAAPGGAAAVDRALSLLSLFSTSRHPMGLTELAAKSRLYKSTVLRLLASLGHAGLVQRQAEGRYVLGPAVARLHASYVATFSLEAVVMPALRVLVDRTTETAAFHVRQGDHRVCLYRVDSTQPVRLQIRVGDVMPLDRGAGGRVLLAYAGVSGALYERIRHEQVAVMAGDRVPDLAGVSAPVFDAAGTLAGAVTLTMPKERLSPSHAPCVLDTAREITSSLGGVFPNPEPLTPSLQGDFAAQPD
jgi:DNA-binding IclR family transcriptional regulator